LNGTGCRSPAPTLDTSLNILQARDQTSQKSREVSERSVRRIPQLNVFLRRGLSTRPLLIPIERGLFAMDNEGMNVALMLERPHKMRAGRCGLRLCFDQSPYPSIESTKKEGPFGSNTGYLDLSKYTYAVGKEFLASAKYTATRNGSHASETRCATS
jgi:hypothetical protein